MFFGLSCTFMRKFLALFGCVPCLNCRFCRGYVGARFPDAKFLCFMFSEVGGVLIVNSVCDVGHFLHL